MKPVAESSKAADTERFEAAVGVWKPTTKKETGMPKASPSVQPHNINLTLDTHPVPRGKS